MARYTTFNPKENEGGGITNRWQVTRYKSSLSNATCATGDVGGAGDYGIDPTPAAILLAACAPTAGICYFPTPREWSAGVEAMLFWVEIWNNAADDLKLDIEFYEMVYGSTGAIETGRMILSYPNAVNGDVIGVETDGAQVFARIAGVTNPDGSAQLYLSCKRASHSVASLYEGGGDGLDLDLTGIGRAVAAVVDDHDVTHTHELGLKILAEALDGALIVAGYDRSGAQSTMVPVEISNAVASGYGVPILGRASATVPTAVATGDVIAPWYNRSGATMICGWDEANTVPRELPIVSNSANHPDIGVTVSWRADAGIPTAVADGEGVAPRADLTGSLGTHLTNALSRTNDSVTSWDQPPTGDWQGTRDCTVANTAYPIVAVSTPCVGVFLTAAEANAGICLWGSSTLTTAGAGISKASQAPSYLIPIDDAAKIHVASSNAGDDVNFAILTR
jgi:hypothetical protein